MVLVLLICLLLAGIHPFVSWHFHEKKKVLIFTKKWNETCRLKWFPIWLFSTHFERTNPPKILQPTHNMSTFTRKTLPLFSQSLCVGSSSGKLCNSTWWFQVSNSSFWKGGTLCDVLPGAMVKIRSDDDGYCLISVSHSKNTTFWPTLLQGSQKWKSKSFFWKKHIWQQMIGNVKKNIWRHE